MTLKKSELDLDRQRIKRLEEALKHRMLVSRVSPADCSMCQEIVRLIDWEDPDERERPGG